MTSLTARWEGGSRNGPGLAWLWVLLLLGAAAATGGLMLGAVSLSPLDVWNGLTRAQGADMPATVIWQLRLPRIAAGFVVGGGLAVAGAAMQGLFRNPLADPALIGVSSGAALGAALWIIAGAALAKFVPTTFGLPVAAFVAGVLTTILVYWLGSHRGGADAAGLLLAGIAMNAFAGALMGLLITVANDAQLRSITFWMFGSLGGSDWKALGITSLFVVPGSILLLCHARGLNALLFGASVAWHSGFDPRRLRAMIVVASALIVGSGVALSGMIGFIGLVAPHLFRLWRGADHRALLPGSFLLGGTLLVLADTVARIVSPPAELPIGMVTSLIGAPFLAWLLLRRNGVNSRGS